MKTKLLILAGLLPCLAFAGIITDNITADGAVNLAAGDVRIHDATETNQPVTKAQLDLNSAANWSLYVAASNPDLANTIIKNALGIEFVTDAIAIGTAANGLPYGASIGSSSQARNYGVALGYGATGQTNGVAIGTAANGSANSIGIGYQSFATDGGAIAIGYQAWAAAGSVAIGCSNASPGTTKIKGPLICDGNVSNVARLVGTDVVAGITPGWGLRVGTSRTLTNLAYTVCGFDTITGSNRVSFVAASFRVIPQEAGWYVETVIPDIRAVSAGAGAEGYVFISKNGGASQGMQQMSSVATGNTPYRPNHTVVEYFNGTTDYADVQVYHNFGNAITNIAASGYEFRGRFIGK